MSVALNTPIFSLSTLPPEKNAPPSSDGPGNNESFDDLYKQGSPETPGKEAVNSETDPQSPAPSNIEDPENDKADTSLTLNTEDLPTAQRENALLQETPVRINPTDVQTDIPILSLSTQNAAGTIDPSEFAEQLAIRTQVPASQGGETLSIPEETNRPPLVQGVQTIPTGLDVTAQIPEVIPPGQMSETGDLVKLAANELSPQDIKNNLSDTVIGRIETPSKIPLSQADIPQDRVMLAAENYIKTAAMVPTATNIDPTALVTELNTLAASPVTTTLEAAQRTTAAPTILNTQTQAPTLSPAMQIVSNNLIKALVSQTGVIMQLDPPEMGNVQINFQFDSERAVTAVIRSELADTSSFLRDRAEHLQQVLKDSGFDSVSLSFEQGSQSHQEESFDQKSFKEKIFSVDEELASKAEKVASRTRTSNIISGDHPVDIKL